VKPQDRSIAVFSTSAIDLFASALGAFILLMMLLFPYYRNAGDDDAYSKTEDLMQQRRLAMGKIASLLADNEVSQSELKELDLINEGVEAQISRLMTQLNDLKTQLAEVPVPVQAPEPVTEEPPADEAAGLRPGVAFSLLGIDTQAKSFVIVVDMSGSMMNYSDLMISSVLEVLAPFNEDNEFAILGYQGIPAPVINYFPRNARMAPATPENLRNAALFVTSLSRSFEGSTPTHHALLMAMQMNADAIVLMSDGQPDSSPGTIIRDIANLNRFEQREIHTVAIGDYTQNRDLVIFLQALAKQNNGHFVGVSR
jgi:hypothetical protein